MRRIIKCACCQKDIGTSTKRKGIMEIKCDRAACGAINIIDVETGEQSFTKPEKKRKQYTDRVASSGSRYS